MKHRNALIISDYDSRISWSSGFVSRLKAKGFNNTFVSLNPQDNLDQLQIRKYIDEVFYIESFQGLKEIFNEKYSIVVLAVGGTMHLKIYDTFKTAYKFLAVRPILITGFNGIEDKSDPDGLFCRSISDYICVNNSDFCQYASNIIKNNKLQTQLVRTGFIRNYWDTATGTEDVIKKVMFILQPGILDHPKQLEHLGKWLLSYSEKYPERQVILKARGRKDVKHVNSKYEKDSFLEFWQNICNESNGKLSISFLEMEQVLPLVDLVLSYTSAGLLEALILGKKVAAISDFGISKSIGNVYLSDSNLLSSTNDLLSDEIPQVDLKWYQRWCRYNGNLVDELIDSSYEEFQKQYKNGKLNFIKGYYNQNTHSYLFRFRYFDTEPKLSVNSGIKNMMNKVRSSLKQIFR